MTFRPLNADCRLIEAIVLFGSKSRGDHDEGSDTDLAVFVPAFGADDLVAAKRWLTEEIRDSTANLSVYSMATVEKMAAEGSLFLWHLKLEGKIPYQRSDWVNQVLTNLSPYSCSKALRDLSTFRCALTDVQESLAIGGRTVLFEAATLYSILRSLGMILTTLMGKPRFGRIEPISRMKDNMGERFQLSDEDIARLLNARLVYSDKRPAGEMNIPLAWCQSVIPKVARVIEFVEGTANESTR
jgi:predicted nucleotidyltransferase